MSCMLLFQRQLSRMRAAVGADGWQGTGRRREGRGSLSERLSEAVGGGGGVGEMWSLVLPRANCRVPCTVDQHSKVFWLLCK